MERKITIEESVPYTEDYQNKMLEEGFLTLTILSTDCWKCMDGEWMTKAVMIMM